MKNQILEMLVDFADKIDNNTSVFSGSAYTKSDVIIFLFAERIEAATMQEPVRPARIDEDTITKISEIAEQFAVMHAQNCAENYDFNVDFNTNEYRGELTVTADLDVDPHSLARSATFRSADVKTALRELLTPNAQPNA